MRLCGGGVKNPALLFYLKCATGTGFARSSTARQKKSEYFPYLIDFYWAFYFNFAVPTEKGEVPEWPKGPVC